MHFAGSAAIRRQLKIDRRGAEMRVVGPIYAGKQCLACHAKAAEILGAFTYVLEREPVKKAKYALGVLDRGRMMNRYGLCHCFYCPPVKQYREETFLRGA